MTRAWAPLISVALIISLLLISFGTTASNEFKDTEDVEEDVSFEISQNTHFIKNMGQWDEEFEYIGTTGSGAIGIAEESIYFNVHLDENTGQLVEYSFIGSKAESIQGSERLSHMSNFYLGNDPSRWTSSVPSFNIVTYNNLWDGIDLVYTTRDSELKYEFILNPNSEPNEIRVEVTGADLTVDDHEITIQLEKGAQLKDSGLNVFYGDEGRENIEARFMEIENGVFGFQLNDYDRSRPVVIDPFVEISTFLGTSRSESFGQLVRDESGEFYGVGATDSTSFPVTAGVYSTTNSGRQDVVVYKMDSTLSTLIYSTYLGGSGYDYSGAIAPGTGDSLFVAGATYSSDFPTSTNAYDDTYYPSGSTASSSDGWIVRFDDNCTSLGYGTYLGVKENESIWEMYVDSSNNAIAIGYTGSSDFPSTNDAYDSTHNGAVDIFVTKMNASGDKLLHSTFIGGSNEDWPYGMTWISDDVLYLTGSTRSSNFPTTPGAYDTIFNGGTSGFNTYVLKYNISSASLDLSTFMGVAYGNDIEIDDDGRIHVVGTTRDSSFPTTTGAYDTTSNGQEEGIYFRFNPSGSQLQYSTFVGGSGWDTFISLDINSTGSVFIAGYTRSTNYPTTKGCYDSTHGGGWDAVVSRLNEQGTRMVYSTYIGGSSDDEAHHIFLEDENTAYIGGFTESSTFPTTTGAYDTGHNGNEDFFISKVNLTLVLLPPEKVMNLTGAMTEDRVNLQWKEPTDDGGSDILHYNIWRGTHPNYMEIIDNTTDLQYEDTGLNIRETYYYTVTATNSVGVSQKHTIISVREMMPPTFNGDLTPMDPLPGTEIVLTANITDNVEVSSVWVEYWIGGSVHENESMENATGNAVWTYMVPLPDINTDLTYKFSAVDVKGNRIGTDMFKREIRGEVYPVLWNDQTPNIASPSSEFTFSIDVRDNHQINQVKVEFWVDEGGPSNNSMIQVEATDTYTFTTIVPNVIDKNLNYIFVARDNDLKWNKTLKKSVPIMDISPPEFLSDNSDTEGETGAQFTFKVTARDNLHLNDVIVDYWIDGGTTTARTMVKGSGDEWRRVVTIPDVATVLYYRFRTSDPAGNTNSTITRSVNITDTIGPVFLEDLSDPIAYSYSHFTFRAKGGDNLGLTDIEVVYWFNEEEKHWNYTMKRNGEFLQWTIFIHQSKVGYLNYLFILTDTSNKTSETGTFDVEILDLIPPEIQEIEDLTIYVGEFFSVSANASDNVGVKTISWIGGPISSNNLVFEGTVETNGTFDINVVVTDPSGNSASTWFTLTILSIDHDGDSDGIPDLVEMEIGLDKDDHFDGYGDLDSDGLVNWVEHSLGLSLIDPDTDQDGMPDAWEYENGLDPLEPSSTNDTDRDTITDLEEYQQGTDPRISDLERKRTEEFDSTFLVIILILFIIALLAVWGFVGFRFMTTRKVEHQPPPEPDLEEKEEEELEKMLHDLPPEEPVPEPQYDTFDFEPAPEVESQVSDLFPDGKIQEQEPPLPEEEPVVDQGPVEEEPFAEQPIQTLDAGEVIQ